MAAKKARKSPVRKKKVAKKKASVRRKVARKTTARKTVRKKKGGLVKRVLKAIRGKRKAASPRKKRRSSNSLIGLARRFDKAKDMDMRIAMADDMKQMLGDKFAGFEQRYEALLAQGNKSPASTALRHMGLVGGRRGAKSPKLARSTVKRCGKTCRLRTKGMGVGEVRLRRSSQGHVFELARVE